jgi:2-methylisocitrate lyase-like PEP mutase family enzyme
MYYFFEFSSSNPQSMSANTAARQLKKAEVFKSLHEKGVFVIPNPWDAGSAKMLAILGFEALATTSSGLAFSMSKPDDPGAVKRTETLNNVRAIAEATELPVSADLQNGYGDDPEACAGTILLTAATGAVGGSIEDATGREEDPIYPFDLSVRRVRAAVKAARSLPFPFQLVARAENFFNGRTDLDDTIRRLQAYAEVGADVLYAPGLSTKEEIIAVAKAVAPKPVNVLLTLPLAGYSLEELGRLGVRRISLGSALARAAYGAFFRAAQEISLGGSFSFSKEAIPYAEINGFFKR